MQLVSRLVQQRARIRRRGDAMNYVTPALLGARAGLATCPPFPVRGYWGARADQGLGYFN